MDKLMDWIKAAFAAIGGAIAWFFGPWDLLIGVLLAFVAADYLMGVINAGMHGALSSAAGWKGLLRKAAIFMAVATGALLDKIVPDTNGAVRASVCLFYIANEGLSVLENIGAMGVPLPARIKRMLLQLKDAEKEAEEEKE